MTEPLHRTPTDEIEHLQKIIANAYQIAGAYGAPGNILDVLSGPMFSTDKQVENMLPFVVPVQVVPPVTYDLPNSDKKGLVIKPEGGWKPHTVYLVDVSWRSSNPIHRALLHTGFINDNGTFGGYCEVWCNSYDLAHFACEAFYLKVILELVSTK